MRKFNHSNKKNKHFGGTHRRSSGRPYAGERRFGSSAPRQSSEDEKRFMASIAVDPSPRIRLEDGSAELTMRAMDLICPIGMGQRGLIVAPPGSGKTTILKHICESVAKSHPEIKLYCLLIDERPEEVTDFRRSVTAEVHWSSTDETYAHHIQVANDLMQKAYAEATAGQNVMIVIDSLTRLSRVHNAERKSTGRTLSGGVDVRAMEIPRKIFGSARNIEGGGSLTILATILIETGSRMDDVIFEEFKGTGNMELVLSRELSNRRIYPAIDIAQSGTRKIELLLDAEELQKITYIKRALAECDLIESAKMLMDQLEKFPDNRQMLQALKV